MLANIHHSSNVFEKTLSESLLLRLSSSDTDYNFFKGSTIPAKWTSCI